MNKLIETKEIIVLLSFMISTVALLISYTNFRSVVGREDYQTLIVLSLLVISFIITVSYGIYLIVRAIKRRSRS